MKKFYLLCGLIILLLSTGCQKQFNQEQQTTNPGSQVTNQDLMPTNISPTPNNTIITYFISPADPLQYCNGGDMDSQGYRATITKKIATSIPETNLSREQLIKKTIQIANQQSQNNFSQAENNNNYIKISGATAYIEPTDGWAGVSIALCSWQPWLEVNLLQFPEIKKVVWVNDFAEWENIK